MKQFLLLIVFTLAKTTAGAQGKAFHVPLEVNQAFTAQYPDGRLKKWERNKEGYMAIFRQNREKCVAFYTPAGIWEKTESPVKWTWNLPRPVQDSWSKSNYKDWLILGMQKIVMPEQTLYSLHVGLVQSLGPDDADIGSEYVLFFSENGNLLQSLTERRL